MSSAAMMHTQAASVKPRFPLPMAPRGPLHGGAHCPLTSGTPLTALTNAILVAAEALADMVLRLCARSAP